MPSKSNSTVVVPIDALTPTRSRPLSAGRAPADDRIFTIAKPHWHRGLALMPQHFEAQDRYHEQRLNVCLDLVFDHPWGIAELSLRTDSIESGELVVQRLSAVLPDGTPIAVGAGGPTDVMARSFDAALRTQGSIGAYVGILRELPGRPMIDGAEAGPLPLRFAREASMVPEYGTGQNPVSVPWLRPNVRILFDGDAFDDYSVLPLARIVRLPNGRAALDERYVPPVLRTHASPFLVALFQQLESSISATHSALAAQRREGADMTRSDAARIVLLMLLGRALPRVADLLRSNTHPRDAYRVVSELVGGLSAIGTAGAVAIPPFNHMELGATFEALTTSALDVLEAVAAPRYRAIQVRAFDRNVRRVELREPGIFGKQFVVVVAGEDAVRIRSELSRSAKVGPDDRISTLISSAVAGIGLVPESRRPTGLAVPPGAVCFSLVQQGPLWDEVVMKGSLTFFLPDAFSGAELSLFVREPGVLE